MRQLFESADIFAHQINFNYERKNLYHSFFGMGLSFALYGIMIYFVCYFSTDLIYKQNPRIKYEETEFIDSVNITVKDLFDVSSIEMNIEVISNDLLYNTTYGSTKNLTSEEMDFG